MKQLKHELKCLNIDMAMKQLNCQKLFLIKKIYNKFNYNNLSLKILFVITWKELKIIIISGIS
jgi:hypothetical protein